MRAMAFAGRNRRELLRDPLTIGFGLGFPLVLLALLSAIGRHAPVENFAIEALAPGVASFGADVCRTVFGDTARPRPLARVYGAALRFLDAAKRLSSSAIFADAGAVRRADRRLLSCSGADGPPVRRECARLDGGADAGCGDVRPRSACLCGTLLNDRQASGICGAVLTNGCAWLSGIWFDLALLGEGFERAAHLLPVCQCRGRRARGAGRGLCGDGGAAGGRRGLCGRAARDCGLDVSSQAARGKTVAEMGKRRRPAGDMS